MRNLRGKNSTDNVHVDSCIQVVFGVLYELAWGSAFDCWCSSDNIAHSTSLEITYLLYNWTSFKIL